jgi:hypothetical protein
MICAVILSGLSSCARDQQRGRMALIRGVAAALGITVVVALAGCSSAAPSAASPASPAPDITSGAVKECSLIADDDTEVEVSGPGAPQACQEAVAGRWPSYFAQSGQWQSSTQPANDPLSSEICTASTAGSIWTFYNASADAGDTQAECQALQQAGWQITWGQG